MQQMKMTFEIQIEDTTIQYQSTRQYRYVAVVKWASGEYEIVRKTSAIGDDFWTWKHKISDDYSFMEGVQVFFACPRLVRDLNLHINQLSAKYVDLRNNITNSETYPNALNTIWEMETLLHTMRKELKERMPKVQIDQVA